MNGKEAIIAKIISDAEKAAAGVIEEAKAKAQGVIDEANGLADEYRHKFLDGIDTEKANILRRRKTVAELDINKLFLSAKQKAIDEVMSRVRAQLVGMSDKEYTALVSAMLERYAEDGEEVIFPSVKKKLFGKAFVDGFNAKSGKKLVFNGNYGDFCGGIILANGGIYKNLTFELEVDEARERYEREIADKLFGKDDK